MERGAGALSPRRRGLLRCGKSCRLRWINYLRPGLRRGNFTMEEDELIIKLYSRLSNRWSLIAARLPGRTDNEIKNHWNTHVSRKLLSRGIDPATHRRLIHEEKETGRLLPYKQEKIRSSSSNRCPDLNLDLCLSPPSQKP
ncbi:hypothetical protein MUK42_29189 [Musa troglodytarum]|uniref:Uncharacterized protein n=1 Tax=Musa troglodytarum TaxID=320322 RepID=A0A9E7JXP8_9LILI|nr:hypothetical protein MUK42_29189 [Musa troglodytarum]